MKNSETAKRLTTAMSLANITQQELSDRSGVGKASISQYCNGSHAPSNVSAGKMAKVLGVSPVWLMGFDVPMERTTPIPGNPADGRKARLEELFDRLSDADQDEIISLIEWKLSKK